jgi:hypothetical protein
MPERLQPILEELVDAGLREVLAEADSRARSRAAEILADRLVAAYVERAAASRVPAEPGGVCYLYAVTAGAPDLSDLVGVDGRQPNCVEAGRLVGVVSEIRPELLTDLESEELTESSRLANLARRHDAVVEAVFQRATVLPMRFGTTFASETDMTQWLESAADALAAELTRLEGAREWVLKVLFVEQGRENRNDEGRHEPELTVGSGTAYLAARAEAQTARQEANQRLQAALDTLAAGVEATVEESCPIAWLPEGAVHASAHLVRLEMEQRFLAAVESAGASLAEAAAQAQVSGPLPPYHFVDSRPGPA